MHILTRLGSDDKQLKSEPSDRHGSRLGCAARVTRVGGKSRCRRQRDGPSAGVQPLPEKHGKVVFDADSTCFRRATSRSRNLTLPSSGCAYGTPLKSNVERQLSGDSAGIVEGRLRVERGRRATSRDRQQPLQSRRPIRRYRQDMHLPHISNQQFRWRLDRSHDQATAVHRSIDRHVLYETSRVRPGFRRFTRNAPCTLAGRDASGRIGQFEPHAESAARRTGYLVDHVDACRVAPGGRGLDFNDRQARRWDLRRFVAIGRKRAQARPAPSSICSSS